MLKPTPACVDEYIAAYPAAIQRALQQVRAAVRKAAPQAVESIAYKMPAYKIHDETLLHFAAWKRHYSLYCATRSIVAEFKN